MQPHQNAIVAALKHGLVCASRLNDYLYWQDVSC